MKKIFLGLMLVISVLFTGCDNNKGPFTKKNGKWKSNFI